MCMCVCMSARDCVRDSLTAYVCMSARDSVTACLCMCVHAILCACVGLYVYI